MENFNCVICLDIVKCPATFTPFNPTKTHKCFRKNYLCHQCLFKHLGLHKRFEERLVNIKCPLCNIIVGKSDKNDYALLEYNFAIIKTMDFLYTKGKIGTVKCYCDEEFNSQESLKTHQENTCPKFLIKCDCGRHHCRTKDDQCFSNPCPYCGSPEFNIEHIFECKEHIEDVLTPLLLQRNILEKIRDNIIELHFPENDDSLFEHTIRDKLENMRNDLRTEIQQFQIKIDVLQKILFDFNAIIRSSQV